MLKLEDIKVGDFIKVNDFKALGAKGILFKGSPIKESYEVFSIHSKDSENDKSSIAVILETREDGRHPCGIIFEEDLHAIELVE